MIRACAVLLLILLAVPLTAEDRKPPNVLLIMADDLGYSDLGCYGSEIHTPNLDTLAKNGLQFTQFHNTARCWPTRAALLTGYYAQQVKADTLPDLQRGNRPDWGMLLPMMLRPAGYRSYHSGKWHLTGQPLEAGFDRSYLLQDTGRFFSPRNHFEDDRKLPPVPPGSGYYATTAMADHAIRVLKDHAGQHTDRPFFHYLAFTAPHFPLHALPEDIARYQDVYRVGWEEIRRQRWEKMRQLGLGVGPLSEPEPEIGPPYHFPDDLKTLGAGEVNRPLPWSSLTAEQRQFQAAKMAVHAAMVDRMDREIGRVLEQLKAMNAFENTLIFFLSDNGASAEIMVRDDGHDPAAAPGSAASHLCLGPGWSTVCNTPFRRHKTWVHQGGICTPLVVHWPAGLAARGELRHNPGHVIDIVPTILQVTGGVRPALPAGPTPPGRSLVPAFAADHQVAHASLWWYHEGNRAIRLVDWKLVAAKDQPWELYDLYSDRAETGNLAEKYPETVKKLAAEWERQAALFSIQARNAPPAVEQQEPPLKHLILPGEAFQVQEKVAFILWPEQEKRSKPQPWVMYAPTLSGYPDVHEQWMHQQFLDAGIAVAGIDAGEAYGSPEGRKAMDALYVELTKNRGFAAKPCLLGRSRGGLWVSSWASRNAEKVAGIAGIYPVFDLRTYPGLERAAPAYGLKPGELAQQLGELNPIEQAGQLVRAKIPVFIIHGDADQVVPLEQNSAELKKRYEQQQAGDLVTLQVVRGQGHNYWPGFFRSQELVDFVIRTARPAEERKPE